MGSKGSGSDKERRLPAYQTVMLQWTGSIGFGLLTISDDEHGDLDVDTEGLGREFLVSALDAFKARVLKAYDEEQPDG